MLFLGGILSYDMRQGEKRGPEVDLYDFTYDQNSTTSYLSGGLGQLTDGIEGHSNFRLDPEGRGRKGYEWVGWKNDSFPESGSRPTLPGSEIAVGGPPVEILFTFDSVRNFSSVVFHCNNLFSKDVRVFRQVTLYFSVTGSVFQSAAISFDHPRDTLSEFARNVKVPIPHRIGRFIRVVFAFDSRWMLISEIRFESG